MSRFADPTATDLVDLGSCQCPGTPHERDEAVIRTSLGHSEESQAGVAGWAATNGAYFDWEKARDKLLEIATIRWTLLDESGAPVPVSATWIGRLDEATRNVLAGAIDEKTSKATPLPNASGAHSGNGSRASASRTRKTPTGS